MDSGLLFGGELLWPRVKFLKTCFGVFDLPVCCFCFAVQHVIFVYRGVSLHRKFCDVIIALYAWLGWAFAFVALKDLDLFAIG